jgi:hypothetical protein
MSAGTAAPQGQGEPRLLLGGEPRVQLLPPTVAAREKVRGAQRMVVLLVIAAIAIAGAMYGFGLYLSASAQNALTSEQAQTQVILKQQATYKEGADAAGMVAQLQQAQQVATSLEIDWAPILRTFQASLPAGASMASVTIDNQAPWAGALAPEGVMRTPRIAVVSLVIASPGPIDVTRMTAAMSDIPGRADVKAQSVQVDGAEWKTTIDLTLDSDALSGRYPSSKAAESSEGDSK